MTQTIATSSVGEVALWCARNGISVIPINPRTKRPLIEWKIYQSEIATEAQVQEWHDRGMLQAVAVIGGKVSGGLLVLDFDVDGYINRFADLVGDLTRGMPMQRTGGGGYQILLRCPNPGPNVDLAWEPSEQAKTGREIAIETRGEGGYAVVPPSGHPTGNHYKWIYGDLSTIPTVSQSVADQLLAAARKLDRCPLTRQKREQIEAEAHAAHERRKASRNGDTSIIETFNQSCTIQQALEKEGYTAGSHGRFIRPGGTSESVSIKDGRSYHHSTNDLLCDGHAHDAFDVMACYHFGGDHKKAVRGVAEMLGLSSSRETPGAAWQVREEAAKEPKERHDEPLPDPIPLTEPDPPPFPSGIFSGWMGDAIDAVSANTETPKELAASVALGVLAITAQGKLSVRPEKNYFESTSLYVASILASGHRKTSVVSWFTKPLIEYERRQRSEMEPKIKRAAIVREATKAQVKALKGQLEKSAGEDCSKLIDQIAQLELSIQPDPVFPRVFTQDVTPEHLGTMMNLHGERIGLISDEGGIFDTISGKYNNNIPNLDLILQAYSGSPVRVDRGSRDPVMLNHPALTMVITPQPDVASGLAARPGFRGRGLIGRFLFTMPKSVLGSRTLQCRGIDDRIERDYAEYVNSLLALPTPKESGADGPIALLLDDGAYAAWKGYQRKIETMMQPEGRLEHLTDVGGKWPGMAARLAAILHVADYGAEAANNRHINGDVMERAILLADFFLAHGLVVFSHFGADKPLQIARRLWLEIEKLGKLSFSAREVWQPTKGTFKTMEEVWPGFEVLVERGWLLEPGEKDDKRGRGRPSRRYTVNPKVLGIFEDIEDCFKGSQGGK